MQMLPFVSLCVRKVSFGFERNFHSNPKANNSRFNVGRKTVELDDSKETDCELHERMS